MNLLTSLIHLNLKTKSKYILSIRVSYHLTIQYTYLFSYRPEHPKHYDPGYNYYDRYQKPNANYPNRYGSVIPHPNDYDHPGSHYDYLFVRPNSDFEYDRPNRPMGTRPEYDGHRPYDQPDRPSLNHEQGYDGPKPQRPDGSLRPKPDYGDASQRYDNQLKSEAI